VLDVDGDCGGYNLHFAWASGIKAGRMMARF
ncbi:MAG: NAD(P)/FAD-dependent oxidoreductase, partial [Campylobacterales bacterium]|nr:NAD(P)/FAD-dependent oxidoreductase [Campylobacterales bacterium]